MPQVGPLADLSLAISLNLSVSLITRAARTQDYLQILLSRSLSLRISLSPCLYVYVSLLLSLCVYTSLALSLSLNTRAAGTQDYLLIAQEVGDAMLLRWDVGYFTTDQVHFISLNVFII